MQTPFHSAVARVVWPLRHQCLTICLTTKLDNIRRYDTYVYHAESAHDNTGGKGFTATRQTTKHLSVFNILVTAHTTFCGICNMEMCQSITANTVYPKKYAHGFVVLCFVVVMQSFIMNSHEVFIHIHQGCFAGTGAIVRLPQCQWIKPDGYGKISQCINTTKHSKAKTVCIFLGIYWNPACTSIQKAFRWDTWCTFHGYWSHIRKYYNNWASDGRPLYLYYCT